MSEKDDRKQRLIDKYKPFIARAGGGIFSKVTRERLVGIKDMRGRGGRYGLDKKRGTEASFMYRRRNEVRNALKDLELFIECADREQVDQVLSRESLEPIVRMLLSSTIGYSDASNPVRAEIADMLILLGFRHLKEQAGKNITLSHERTISEAVDLSDYLVHTIKGEPYYTPREVFGTRGRI